MSVIETVERPTGLAARWGEFVARHRRAVLAVWVVLLAACAVAYPALESRVQAPDFNPDHAEYLRAGELVRQHFPNLGDEQDLIVFDSATLPASDPGYRATVDAALATLRGTDGITGVLGPYDSGGQISADGHTALALIGMSGPPRERAARVAEIQDRLARSAPPGIDVAATGYLPLQNDLAAVERGDLTRAEAIGLPVALLVMVVALGALVAAAVPVGVGLAGILLVNGVLFLLSFGTGIDVLMNSMASMIRLGIGIDYAMFVVSRYREELARAGVTRRDDPGVVRAVGIAMNTAGRTVLASGVIVAVSVIALTVIRASTFRGLALAVSVAVLGTLAVAMVLLPALLAELGPAVNRGALPARLRPAAVSAESAARHGNWYRWARMVMRRPVVFGLAATAVLVVAALPLLRIDYGLNMGIGSLADRRAGAAAQTVAAKFPPGTMAPIEVVVTGPGDTELGREGAAQLDRLVAGFRGDDRVATSIQQRANGRALVIVVPTAALDDPRADSLVRDLRDRARELPAIDVAVGGTNAGLADFSVQITRGLPWVIAFVLVVSFAFLVVAFRSIVLPLKAIAMNLLATGAALGLTVAVFQWGWGESLLRFHSPGYLQVFLPCMVFVILFGLSMDYEVFLIRRMKERWDAAGESGSEANQAAVAEGIEHTARPITAAAAIMVVIFGSFVSANVLELKEIGFALAVAVTLDAVVVRMVLVPAFMRLLGEWNWWLPGFGSRGESAKNQVAVRN
ncbi:MMPL family transporter [Nocardia sp. NPDC003482]